MAFNKHKESDLFILLLTTAFIMPVLATTNIDCKGKAFHCFNSTHFKICVDLGGVSKTVDDFLIPCPPSTVCTENNYFECEYQISTTSAAMPIQSDVTNEFIEKIESTPWELFDVTTLRSVNNVENVTLLENSTITLSEIVSDAVGFEIDNNNTYVNDLLNEEITASYPHNTKKNDLSDSDKSNLPQQVSILNKQLTSTTITSATIDNVSSNISSAAVSENYSGTASDLSIELINTIVTTPLSTGEDVDFTQLFSTVITDNLKKSDSTRKVKNYLTNDISIGVYEPVTTTPMNNIRNNDLISTELLSPLETDNLSTSLATEKSSIYSGSQSKISSNLYKDVTSTSTTTVSEVSAFAKLFSPFKTNDLSPRNSFTTEKSEVLVDLFNSYNTIGPLALATTKANPMSITNVAMKNDNLESSSIKEKKPPINRVDPTSTHTSVADSTLTEIAISSCTESEISIDLNKNVTPSPKNQDYISTKSSYSKKRMDLTPNTTAATKGNIVTKSEILVDLFNPVTKAPLKNVVTEEFNKDLMPTTKYFSENKNYINAENIVKEISSDNINFSSFSDYNLASTQQYTTIPPPTGATTKTNEFNATNVVLNSLESSSINKESTHINRIVNTSAHTSTADSVLEDKVAIFSGTESQPSIDLYKKVIPAPNNQELSSLGNTVSTSTAAPKKYIVTESGISVDLFNTVIPTSLDEKENEELNKDFIPTKKSFLVNENYINAENIGKGSSSDNINLFSFSDYNLLSTQQYTTIGPPTGATTKANELNAMRITNVAKKTNTLESTSINDKNSRTNRIDSTQTSMADFVLKEKKEIYSDAEREISMDLYKHAIPAPKNQDYTSTKIPSSQEKVDLSPINSITTAATKEYTVTESEILVDLFNPVTTTSMNNMETEEINKDNIPTTKSLSANENYIITQNIVNGSSSNNMNFSSLSDYNFASTQQYTTLDPQIQNNTIYNELNAVSFYKNASEFYTNVAMKTSQGLEDSTTAASAADATLVALNNTMEGFSITEQHDFVPLISKSNLISEKIETSSLLDSDGGNVYQSTNMKGVNLQSKASTINLNGWFTNITKKISNGAVKEILMPKNESDIKGTTSPSADFIPKVTNAYSDETNFTAPVNIRLNNTTDLFLIQDNNVLPSPIMLATENIVTKSSDVYDTTIRIIAESHITNTNQDNNMTNANLSILYINNETPLYPSTTENQIPLKTENVTYGMGISKNVTKIDISTRMIINEHNSTSAKPVNLNTKPLIYYNNSYAGSNDNIFSSTNTQTTTENVAKSLSLILQSSEITQTKDSSSREGNILPPLVRDIQNSSFGEAKKTIIFHTSRDLKLDKGSTYSISKKEFPVSTEFILTKTSKNIFNDKIRTIDEDQDNITPALEINNNRISSTSSGMHILVSTDRPSLLRPDLLYNKNKYATNTLKPIPSQLKNSNFQSNTAPAKIQNENTTKGNTILTNHTKANSQITQMQMKKTSIPEKELRVSATPTIDFVDIAIKSKNISTYSILSDNINNENNKIKEEPTKIVSEFGGLNIQDNIAKSVLLSNQQLQNVTHNNANNSQLHKKKNIDSTDYTYNKLILDGNTQSPSFDKIDIALQPLKTKIETISLGVERNNEAKDTLSRNLVNISAINGQLFHKSAESRTIRPNSLMNRSSSFYLPSFKNHTFNNSTSKVINLTDVNNIFLGNFMNKQRESLDTANQSSKFNRTQIITKLVDNSSTSSSNTYNMFILKIKVQFNNKSNNLDKYHNNQNVRKTTVRVLKNDDKGLEKNTNKTNIDLMNRNVFNSETTESKFSCNNRHRGKYSDKNNCQNFYICIGRREPIFGECPNKTVFSEISKQCTKNLSHCIRNNQFQCVSPGRFIDIFSDQFYYICVKKKEGHIRFKLKCQKGYHLNKTNLQCVLDLFNGSKSNEDSTKFDSDKSTTESKSKEDSKRKNEEMKNFKDFECKKEGKFVYQNDCRKYYQCSRSSRTVFRRKIKKCDSDEVFNNEKKKCVDEESYECK
ncbi:protein PF14_0175-like [Pararge aegeria]|uniref:protein PF14_0175-like n=1 Tax=Pararge aegeria TaxID=116150 RepID=UPI0019D18CD3|nr:protein PF14_0175-like [Pararge aegeria]